VTFVDRDPVAAVTIRDNLAAVGLAEASSEVVRADALGWLRRADHAFDLALCDPPYDFADWEGLLNGLTAHLAVLESSLPLEAPAGWVVRTTKRYGGTVVTLVQPLPHQAARKGAS
jgi:23S rRNA G2069 N7-methylase RlmK/C1962 C5-methylase RlmI